MQLIDSQSQFDDSNITRRFSQLAGVCNGKWYFTETEVFIASGNTRLLVNALPSICNIIQHFAFESSRAIVLEGSDEMGQSMFSSEAIDEYIEYDISLMTRGRMRKLYYLVRQQVAKSYDANCEKESGLKYVSNSLAAATSMQINERDALIGEMEESGLFEKGVYNPLASVESDLVDAVAKYIVNHGVSADYEAYLDAMRINLGF